MTLDEPSGTSLLFPILVVGAPVVALVGLYFGPRLLRWITRRPRGGR